MRHDGGLDKGGTVEMVRCDGIPKVVPTGVPDELNMKCECDSKEEWN